MTGTPTQPPGGDSAAGQRAQENSLGWGRPVPERFAPGQDPVVRSEGPQELVIHTARAESVGPVNATVMGTAPGEG